MKKIKLILADQNENARTSVRQLLELDHSLDIVAEASSGKEVIQSIQKMEPQVVIMDLNLPEMDGLETCRYININHPQVAVIIISINDEIKNFRKAMLAGAKEYLVKPLSPNELHAAVKEVVQVNSKAAKDRQTKAEPHEISAVNRENRIVTIFGTKGGVGKSIISTNLAVAAGQKYKQQVGLIDLDIQFGDVSVMMNLNPRKTIAELMQEGEALTQDLLEDYLYERNGVQILAAANKPELAELVTPSAVEKILHTSRQIHKYTFVDTPSFIDDISLTALELSDLILLVVTLDLPTIKNVRKGIDILRSLQLLPQTRLILNRSSGVAGIEARDVEKVLDMKIKAEVPSDGKLTISSLNQGIPFIKMNPKAAISKGILQVLRVIEE